MPKLVEIQIGHSTSTTANNIGAGSQYLIQTPTGVLYLVFIDTTNDVSFTKSTDGGFTWSVETTVFTGSVTNLSVWYDRWSGISAGLIHCAYTESVNDDTLYRTIDTENSDALSTETTIFAGSSTLGGGSLSISRARGGNVYCRTCIDAGTEGGFFRLPNANVPNGAWDAARTINEALATTDQAILLPGFAADNQDMILIFWDASANEISRQIYDDSANTWAETTISGAGAAVDVAASTSFPHFAATVDLTNSRILLVAWNGVDTANQDLLGWTVTESAITAFATTPVLNGTDDMGFAAIGIDLQTGYWHVFYGGKSDGSETWNTAINIYYKISKDSGATWDSETLLTQAAFNCTGLYCVPRMYLGPIKTLHLSGAIGLVAFKSSFEAGLPHSYYQLIA